MNRDTIYSGEDGNSHFQRIIEKLQYAAIEFDKDRRDLLLIPEEAVKLIKKDSLIQFIGQNHKGQQLFNSFYHPFFDINESNRWSKDTTNALITSKITLLKNKELENINILYDQGGFLRYFLNYYNKRLAIFMRYVL